jgi:hypothetical protein
VRPKQLASPPGPPWTWSPRQLQLGLSRDRSGRAGRRREGLIPDPGPRAAEHSWKWINPATVSRCCISILLTGSGNQSTIRRGRSRSAAVQTQIWVNEYVPTFPPLPHRVSPRSLAPSARERIVHSSRKVLRALQVRALLACVMAQLFVPILICQRLRG